MKKKVLLAVLFTTALLTLTSCGNSSNTNVNISSDENAIKQVGIGQFKKIGEGFLYYDVTTNIVYLWNGMINVAYYSTAPSPYYAPNGLPYKYNPETNTLEEIEEEY